MAGNIRYKNGARRRDIRAWLLHTQDTCALCGKRIDKSLKTPHPMSAEVDEILPVSKGGSPIDRSNVQLVHRSCNQRKGDKTQSTPPEPRRGAASTLPLPVSREW